MSYDEEHARRVRAVGADPQDKGRRKAMARSDARAKGTTPMRCDSCATPLRRAQDAGRTLTDYVTAVKMTAYMWWCTTCGRVQLGVDLAEMRDERIVVLDKAGPYKVQIIKEIMETCGATTGEGRTLVNEVPAIIPFLMTAEQANGFVERLKVHEAEARIATAPPGMGQLPRAAKYSPEEEVEA